VSGISKYFFGILWLQILAGIAVLAVGFTEPLALVITGAVLNAVAMFVFSGLILGLNLGLPKDLRPVWWRIVMVGVACIVYGSFSAFTIYRFLSGQ